MSNSVADDAVRQQIFEEELARRAGAPVPAGNGMAVAGLVLGIIGLLFGLIPLTFFIALPCGILGTIFGFAGRRRAKRGATGKGMATAGLITGIIAIGLGIAGVMIVNDAAEDLERDLNEISDEFERDMEELEQDFSDFGE